MSTHICDIIILGLPTVLMGHIVHLLRVASLIRIHLLCKAGCSVVFDNQKCDLILNGDVILRGYKDSATDLWMLPLPTRVCTTPGTNVLPQPGPCTGCAPHPLQDVSDVHPKLTLATFTHSVQTRANAVKFAHQLLCNPKILTLLKVVRKGFVKGCPNMTETLILKYLNPSPATAKGHMKHPRHGIHSTRPKGPTTDNVQLLPVAQITPPFLPIIQEVPVYPGPAYRAQLGPSIIVDNSNESITYVFYFGAFADKNSGIVYHNLTRSFPFMSYDGSLCFLVLYHYTSNAILATPIVGLDDMSIFQAYKTYFEVLSAKGYKPKLNTMDNQATKHIKKFLTKNDCKLQVVNAQSKHSRRPSLQHWQQPTAISHCNCGINLPHRYKIPLTCSKPPELIQQNQHMKF
jgi:hypothetical protein